MENQNRAQSYAEGNRATLNLPLISTSINQANVKLSHPERVSKLLVVIILQSGRPPTPRAKRLGVDCSALLGPARVDPVKLTNSICVVEPLASALGIVWVE